MAPADYIALSLGDTTPDSTHSNRLSDESDSDVTHSTLPHQEKNGEDEIEHTSSPVQEKYEDDDYPSPDEEEFEDDECPPSPLPKPNAFAKSPVLIYIQFLGPLLFVSLSCLIIILYLAIHGQLAAPKSVADFSTSSPRVTAQLVTIIATSLTATTRWALGGAATLLARKRFYRQFRPIFEIEHFTAFKNISIIWDWTHRKRMMFLTWVLVVMCGLLTSGFVVLIGPFPVGRQTNFSGRNELDFTSTSPSCLEWYTKAKGVLFFKKENTTTRGCRTTLSYNKFIYSSCLADSEAFLGSRAALLGHYSSLLPSDDLPSFVTSYATLNNTRFLGGTGGSLPTGPAGVQVFSFPKAPPSRNFNYTLNLQGVWLDTDCQYNTNPPANLTLTYSNDGPQMLSYRVPCPQGEGLRPIAESFPASNLLNRLVVAFYCYSSQHDQLTFYLRSFDNYRRATHSAVDFVQCKLVPRVGEVRAVVDSNFGGFRIIKSSGSQEPISNFTRLIFHEAILTTAYTINYSQSKWGGNGWASMIRWLAISRDGLEDWYKPDPTVLELLSRAIQGMFEFEVTRLRLQLTAISEGLDPFPTECGRQVSGEMIENTIGWNLQPTTLLALLPLLVVILTSACVIGRTLLMPGRLTLFDPTSPISLIAAASVGDVKFVHHPDNPAAGIVGDPLDKIVGDTKVSYGYHKGGWGLKSE